MFVSRGYVEQNREMRVEYGREKKIILYSRAFNFRFRSYGTQFPRRHNCRVWRWQVTSFQLNICGSLPAALQLLRCLAFSWKMGKVYIHIIRCSRLEVRESRCSEFQPFVIYFNTILLSFRGLFRRIGMRSRVGTFSFSHSPAIAQKILSSSKFCLSDS